jgi:hypothetical protein
MPRRAKREASEPHSTTKVDGPRPLNREESKPAEVVTLGVGSGSRFIDGSQEPPRSFSVRGLLPVPPEVEAEIQRQEGRQPMTAEYRKTLRDRLTLEQYFSGIDVAFRRRPDGIEVLAAGLDEIAEFRRSSSREERQGVVYGVG